MVSGESWAKALEAGKLKGAAINPDSLLASGLVSRKKQPVKILGTGELKAAVEITAHAFSGTAVKKIEAAGGTVTVINGAGA